MASPTEQSAAAAASGSDKARGTLSELAARILDQLSLSAWLPSAALLLAIGFILQLGTELDTPGRSRNPGDIVAATLTGMANVGLGGAALFVVGVVVATMVTQAFAFEAIRTLEGYWGTNRFAEWVAALRCSHFRRSRKKLEKRRKAYLKQAWKGARAKFEQRERELKSQKKPSQLTPEMIEWLGVQARELNRTVELTEEQLTFVSSIDWRESAPPEATRRIVNIEGRLLFLPLSHRMLPTKLGNVLRSCEDKVGVTPIESFIQEVFDDLPGSLRIEHDDERGRLDLYCSMVFVLGLVAIFVVGRLAWGHIYWLIAAVVLLALAIWLVYRAAIASARAYGALLVTIRKWLDEREFLDQTATDEAPPTFGEAAA